MKKIILFLAIGIFTITPTAFANYTLKAKADVEKTLQQYLKGLLMEINKAFMDNIKRPEKSQPEAK